jgi:hypothetical protein
MFEEYERMIVYTRLHQDDLDTSAISVLDKFVAHVLHFQRDEAFF